MSDELTIGLDIGGTKMAFTVADAEGRILESQIMPTRSWEGANDTLARVGKTLNEFVARYDRIAGIGIGVPGPIDVERGLALLAANLGWQDVPVRDAIQARLARDIPVYVDNDVNAGAIGEGRYGIAKGVENYLYLTVGTGVGGAAVLRNQLLRGVSSSEMEIGHVSLDPINGRRCTCGGRGCLEMTVSGKGMIAHAKQHLSQYPQTLLNPDHLTTHAIIRAAQNDDPLALHLMEEAGKALGIACAWCVNLFNPQLIILGGGLLHASYHLLQTPALEALRAHSLPLNHSEVTLSLAKLKNSALGAAALVGYHQQQAGKS